MDAPTLEEIRRTRERLGGLVITTPVRPWEDELLREAIGPRTTVVLKEELFQRTGSFKPRGALAVMLEMDEAALRRGVTAVSAGNHAMAVAYAARVRGSSAKVVMPRTANAYRVERCRTLGAEVELVDDVHTAFARVREIEANEGRTFVHPFEGPLTTAGTATLGLEIAEQVPEADAVIVPIGGGGLISGVAAALHAARPGCAVYGVEPVGAPTLVKSLDAGQPQAIDAVRTIADSLGAPHAAPYSFALIQQLVEDVVLVDDEAIRAAMRLLFSSAKLAVEPAGAAATAALCGPLGQRLEGRTVVLVVCGANVDAASYARFLSPGPLA